MKREIVLAALGAVALGVVGAGVANAAIPSSSGTIDGCYNKVTHVLKVVDSGSSCNSTTENTLNWNQTGPQGPPGDSGPQGEPGPPGPSGSGGAALDYISSSVVTGILPANQTISGEIDCPPGESPVNLVLPGDTTETVTGNGGTAFMRMYGLTTFSNGELPQGYMVTFNGDTQGSYTFPYQLICARS